MMDAASYIVWSVVRRRHRLVHRTSGTPPGQPSGRGRRRLNRLVGRRGRRLNCLAGRHGRCLNRPLFTSPPHLARGRAAFKHPAVGTEWRCEVVNHMGSSPAGTIYISDARQKMDRAAHAAAEQAVRDPQRVFDWHGGDQAFHCCLVHSALGRNHN